VRLTSSPHLTRCPKVSSCSFAALTYHGTPIKAIPFAADGGRTRRAGTDLRWGRALHRLVGEADLDSLRLEMKLWLWLAAQRLQILALRGFRPAGCLRRYHERLPVSLSYMYTVRALQEHARFLVKQALYMGSVYLTGMRSLTWLGRWDGGHSLRNRLIVSGAHSLALCAPHHPLVL
jgi:hypothetical protein